MLHAARRSFPLLEDARWGGSFFPTARAGALGATLGSTPRSAPSHRSGSFVGIEGMLCSARRSLPLLEDARWGGVFHPIVQASSLGSTESSTRRGCSLPLLGSFVGIDGMFHSARVLPPTAQARSLRTTGCGRPLPLLGPGHWERRHAPRRAAFHPTAQGRTVGRGLRSHCSGPINGSDERLHSAQRSIPLFEPLSWERRHALLRAALAPTARDRAVGRGVPSHSPSAATGNDPRLGPAARPVADDGAGPVSGTIDGHSKGATGAAPSMEPSISSG